MIVFSLLKIFAIRKLWPEIIVCYRHRLHALHTVTESMLHEYVVQLVSTAISWCFPGVHSSFRLLKPCVGNDKSIPFINVDEHFGQGMWRVWERIEGCTGCWWGSLRERGHWGDQDVDGRIILRWIFRKLEGVVGTGWSWLRIRTDGGHLWVR